MSGRVGIEITPKVLRAVVMPPLVRRVAHTVEVPWHPEAPREGVRALRTALAPHDDPDAIAIAVALGFLHVARPALPPATDAMREAMIALEPTRWFVAEAPLAVSVIPGSELALAAETAMLDAVLEALAEWAPIASCEGVPTAIARACPPGTTAHVGVEAGEGEHGVVELRDGVVVSCRRLLGPASDAAIPPASSLGVASSHLAALGAALGDDGGDAGTLAPPAWRARLRGRAWRRLAVATVAAVAAAAFALLSVDRWRERTLAELEREAAALAATARPALDAQARIAAIAGERALVAVRLTSRPDPAAALAAISRALPDDAVILSARATGNEWRIDGTANDAAALVPALDRDGRFQDVRTVSASSRFRDGARSRETFAIALTVHATP